MQGEEISRGRIGEMSSKELVKTRFFSTGPYPPKGEVGRFNELREGKILGTLVVYIQVA